MKKLLTLSSLVITVCLLVIFLVPVPGIQANYADMSLTVSDTGQRDILSEHPPGYYYLSTWMGAGTWPDPFIPAISELTDKWSSIDLREDCTSRNGFCLTFSPDLVTDVSVSQITDSLVGDIEDVKWQSVKTVLKANDIKAKKLPDFIKELLKDKIKPGQDGKERIYLGGLIWGEPQPEYGHETIYDDFSRGTSGSLGTATLLTVSQGWSWTDRDGSFGINGSQQATQDVGSGDLSMSQAVSDLGSTNMYAQATTQNDGDVLGVACRKENNTTLTYYAAAYVTSNQLKAYKVVAGSPTALDSTQAVTYGAGRIIKLQTDGSTITTWYNGTQEHNFTDSSISAGQYAGLFAYGNWVLLDNFEASALSAGTPSMTAGPPSKAFGILHLNSVNWSFGSEFSGNLDDAEAYFYVYNNGSIAINVSANCTNGTGGTGSTLTSGSPGADSFRVSLFKEGGTTSNNLTLTATQQSWITSMAASANTSFEVKLEIGTSTETPPTGKTFYIYFVASAS